LWQFIFGVFLVLHGLVHSLYVGQSTRRFELRPGMVWPDGSWAFSKLLGEKATRTPASIACALAAIGLVAGGMGALLSQTGWQTVLVAAAAFSSIAFILFWDGNLRKLDDQGGVGVLINLALLAAVIVLPWPLP
jgi:hypothetical protein